MSLAAGKEEPPPPLPRFTSHQREYRIHGRHLQNHGAHKYRRKQHPLHWWRDRGGSTPSHNGPSHREHVATMVAICETTALASPNDTPAAS